MTVLVIAALNLATWPVATFAPGLLNSAGTGVSGFGAVAILVPPMQTGNKFYAVEKRQMGRAQGWTIALLCTLV